MSLLIDFCNGTTVSFSKEINKLPNRIWKPAISEDRLMQALQFMSETDKDKILGLYHSERRYISKLGITADTHTEIEKLGIGLHCKAFTSTISMQECIDLVFYLLMGTPLEVTRSIPNYKEFSKSLISLDLDAIDISLEELMSYHKTIELGILKIAEEFCEVVDPQDEYFRTKFINHFHNVLQTKIKFIIEKIINCLLAQAGSGKISLRSWNYGEFVISKDTPEDIEIVIKQDNMTYPISFKSYPMFGYIFEVRG